MTKTHIIIPDSHSKPGVSNRRYEWLGALIADMQPDVIVNIGDHADMESLSSYDKGTKGFEGRRYRRDVEAAIDANERLAHAAGKAWDNARRVITIGNHEDRIDRATNANPALDGAIGISDLAYETFYQDVVPYREPVKIDGVNYCHYFTSGIMGRPIGGEHPAYQLISKHHASCTQGHSHILDYCRRSNSNGSRNGLSVGCFFEHRESYAGPANDMWWRGVIVKTEVAKGDYNLSTISLKTLRQVYG